MPRGKPAGFYMHFRLPLNFNSNNNTPASRPGTSSGDTRIDEAGDDDVLSETSAAGVVLELAVCGSNTAKHAVGRRGFSTHVFHPEMEAAAKRLKQQQLRARSVTKKKPTVAPTEMNSVFVLEIDQSVLAPLASAVAGGDDPTSSGPIGTESEAELEAETIISEIGHRVLELQEAGALAVLVVLDLFDADAFALQFAEDSGVFVPVFMVTKQAQAVVVGSYGDGSSVSEPDRGDSTRRTLWTVQELLDHVLTSPSTLTPQQGGASPPRRPSMQSVVPSFALQPPPPLMARFFYRIDTAAARARGAFANGAAAVMFVENEKSLEPAQARLRRSLGMALPTHLAKKHQLVGLIPHEHGQRLRAASRLSSLGEPPRELPKSLVKQWSLSGAPSTASASEKCELITEVQFELRVGGTTYAWGDAENGRLGLGKFRELMSLTIR